MDVAVVRWPAGNQVAEMSDGDAMHTGPAKPFSTWPACIDLTDNQTAGSSTSSEDQTQSILHFAKKATFQASVIIPPEVLSN